MFKRDKFVIVSTRSLLKNKDVRNLRKALMKQWGCSDKVLSKILPNKSSVECIKFTEKSWAFRISDTEEPLVVDTNGKANYVPTVFALWREPKLCPTLYIASNTSAFVLKGADLMLPGVLVPPSGLNFKKGQAVSITVVGNPYPIGAGLTNMSSDDAASKNMRGRGVKMVQVYRDSLWAFGGRSIPNSGFKPSLVHQVDASGDVVKAGDTPDVPDDEEFEALLKLAQMSEDAAAAARAAKQGAAPPGDGEDAAAGGDDDSEGEGAAVAPAGDSDSEEGEEGAVVPAGAGAGVGAGAGEPAAPAKLEPVGPAFESWDDDKLFEACFMQLLCTTVTDDALPVSSNELYDVSMQRVCPPGFEIDVKRTKFRSLKKFIVAMKKRKLIKTREHKGIVSISYVNRNHKMFREFEAWDEKAVNAYRASGGHMEVEEEPEPSSHKPTEPVGWRPPIVTELFKPGAQMVELFDAVGAAHPEALEKGIVDTTHKRTRKTTGGHLVYNKKAFLNVVALHVRSEDLVLPSDKSVVILDELLHDSLFKGTKKPADGYPEMMGKRDLMVNLIKRSQRFHLIEPQDGSEPQLCKGGLTPVEVSMKKVQGRKWTTIVKNLELFGIPAEEFRNMATKKFACSCSAQPMPGNSNMHVVLIQGKLAAGVIEYLQSDMGLKEHHIIETKA